MELYIVRNVVATRGRPTCQPDGEAPADVGVDFPLDLAYRIV